MFHLLRLKLYGKVCEIANSACHFLTTFFLCLFSRLWLIYCYLTKIDIHIEGLSSSRVLAYIRNIS